ncbi:MAG: RtcB family protein [Coriobacteriales bacterium]|jgi:RNA-splicing ligase RtcB|nr:RtcB family protein [Coriobacteriales bacterium]
MIEITGTHNTAICYTDELEDSARQQIQTVCNQPEFADSQIRIMPDVHTGMGCTIGTTMTISDKIVPGMVGVDIGCGMETVELAEHEIDFAELDALIRQSIPSGFSVRKQPHELIDEIDLDQLRCVKEMNLDRARKSIGTLGGGNHFIEVDRSDDGRLFLVVHSGSRHLGNEVAKHYQAEAFNSLGGSAKHQLAEAIEQLKAAGRQQEIAETIQRLRAEAAARVTLPKDLAYATGQLFEDYLHDMRIIQRFAVLNRQAMVDVMLSGLGLTRVDAFTTIHNYIDTEAMILRKGAVSAKAGEKLLVPINMRDGSLICTGKGNAEWNCSAPHGAGRLMSRMAAKRQLTMDEYRAQMAGIFTTCVARATLDEAPMAYKSLDSIVSQIGPTAEILQRIRPIYNFKAAD